MLSTRGYFLTELQLPARVRALVASRDWVGLDRAMREETLPGGLVFERLRGLAEFAEIEFIISIRSSDEYEDEDGIWHDDGSRVLAFSLSLTAEPESIEGGRLEIRRRRFAPDDGTAESESESIPTPPFGTMIVFATGHGGFEHKINRVSRGERVIIAGWCS